MTEEQKNETLTHEEQMTDTVTNGEQVADTAPSAAQDEGTPSASQDTRVTELEAQIAKLQKESADHRDSWLRSAADFKNFKRRTDQERADLIRSASAGLLLKLLPVADDMERALGGVPAEVAATPWYEGVKLIAQKLQTILESEGVTPIEALGQEFDPNFHEAVIYEATENGQDGKVVAELQKGYKLRDRVLRPTMVKVGQA